MTKLTKSVNTNDDNSTNDSQNTSFSLTKKVEKNTYEPLNLETNTTQISQTVQGNQTTKISSPEDVSKWLIGFIGIDVFEQLKNNKYLQLPYTEENITINQWLDKAIKTIFPQESLQKIGVQIQKNEERTLQLEQMAATIQQERLQTEEKFKQYNLKFQDLKAKIDEAEDDKHKIKSEMNNVLLLENYINDYFKDPEDTSTELRKIISLLHESLAGKNENVGKFIVKFSKGWMHLKSSFSMLGKEEKDNLEIVHNAATYLLSYISGSFISERRPLLDEVAKICSQRFQTYDFISPEQTLNVDPEIHNANGLGSSRIKEGTTFAVVRRETRKAVKYADVKC